ncbi:TetR family transcriptional regulator C-terminal domain-containing protein [Altererythrobacter sp. KTW20L]|uniref:TetR family transcriptional regulator C-terminal domain-containing protein n=1 Tax=Altererythrobacter sp. KTW20L TaxID=2942210 RepID=UPI0020BD7DAF|nr:TetR family transcriptional regulator C-terminal domain-containing protein [Altererythrobacter sp. KTW20L]MCL6251650.1 TetR family transcriptional regulator C-terminal domain-containing protein [Altererythrobacter sp. KTW20L]
MARAAFVREDADVRRQSLIQATAACLAEQGARGVSVRSICRKAGVSAGLLTHYFDGIGDLIVATYRDTGRKVAEAVDGAVGAAGDDPRARLEAYVTASFRPPVLDPDLLATWLAFWSLMKSDPQVAEVHGQLYAEFRGELDSLLRDCWCDRADAGEVRLAAIAINALVDGLWLELCLDERGPFSPAEAEKLALDWLDALIARRSAE